MLTAVGPPIRGEAEGCPILVLLAEGIGAEVAKRGRRLATHVTVVPRALPLPCNKAQRQQARGAEPTPALQVSHVHACVHVRASGAKV